MRFYQKISQTQWGSRLEGRSEEVGGCRGAVVEDPRGGRGEGGVR